MPTIDPWFIRNTGFTQRISEEDKARVLRICPERPYTKGEALFRKGDPATSLYIVVEGQVKLSTTGARGTEQILAICGANDFMGEAFLSGVDHYRADAIAMSQVRACLVNYEQFRRLMVEVPNFVVIFTEILSVHIFDCREQLIASHDPAAARVARVLVEQTRRFGIPREQGWYTLETSLGHEDIGAMVGITRVSVTTAIAQFRERGFLKGTRGSYSLNVPALESLIEPSDTMG